MKRSHMDEIKAPSSRRDSHDGSSSSSTMAAGLFSTNSSAYAQSAPNGVPSINQNMEDDIITDGERLIAKELTMMSINEREAVYEDLHGVSPCSEETPEFVEEKLEELEREVDGLRKKDAFLKAGFLSPRSVRDRSLRLRLLRTAMWDTKKGAKILTKYFEIKLRIFGEDKLIRPIVWDDLSPEAQASIQDGAIVRHDDCTGLEGRSVLIFNFAKFHFKSPQSLLQSCWYLNVNAPRKSQTAQKKGLVVVVNTVGTTAAQLHKSVQLSQQMSKLKLSETLPLRMASNHVCLEDPRLKSLLSVMLLALPRNLRVRFRIHIGTMLECSYQLMSYGISPRLLPFDVDGRPNQELLTNYLQQTRNIEAGLVHEYVSSKPPDSLFTPQPTDCVLGRGWPYQSFEGNIRMTEFLQTYKEMYTEAPTRTEKTRISVLLLERVKATGVRFLRRDGSGDFWMEVDDDIARQKIAMTLRNLARK